MNKFTKNINIIGFNTIVFNSIKASNINIPANKIEIFIAGDKKLALEVTNATDNITFEKGIITLDAIRKANKHKINGKNINDAEFNDYNLIRIVIDHSGKSNDHPFTAEEVNNKKIEIDIAPKKKISKDNITINFNEKTFKNYEINNFINKGFYNSCYGSNINNVDEIEFIELFKNENFKSSDTDLKTEIGGDSNVCIKKYKSDTLDLDFNKRQPTLDERNKMLLDIIIDKKVNITLEKCKKRISFISEKNYEFDKINKRYKQLLEIIEKYIGGRYEKDNITLKSIADEIKSNSVYPTNGKLSIKEENNEKEFSEDTNAFNSNSKWIIKLPEICYKKDIKIKVEFVSMDNNYKVKNLNGLTNGVINIESIEGETLSNLKKTLCTALNSNDEFKENDGLTYKIKGSDNIDDKYVFKNDTTIEILIPNTKGNLVEKKPEENKKEENENKDKKQEGGGSSLTKNEKKMCTSCNGGAQEK